MLERYRIQSDRFEDMWMVVKELVQRFDQHFSKLGVKDFKKSFSGPLPLQDYFLCVDHHFQVPANAAGHLTFRPLSEHSQVKCVCVCVC